MGFGTATPYLVSVRCSSKTIPCNLLTLACSPLQHCSLNTFSKHALMLTKLQAEICTPDYMPCCNAQRFRTKDSKQCGRSCWRWLIATTLRSESSLQFCLIC